MTAPTLPLEAETAPELEHKAAALAAEAAGTATAVTPEGIVRAIVSVTGVIDEVKDIIEPGAYTDTLKRRRPKVVRNHQWSEQVGRVLDIEEYLPGDPRLPKQTKDGRPWPREAGALVATIQYNLATDRGRRAFEDVKFFHESKEAEFSIGYQVPPGASVRGRDGIRRIKRLDLFEVCDVLFGAASLSMSLDVKSALARRSADDGGPEPEFTDDELNELARLHAAAEPDLAAEDAVLAPEGVALPPLDDEEDEAAPLLTEVKRKFTAEERQQAAEDNAALEDGSYPVRTAEDLANAVQAIGRAKDPVKVRRHIIRRARALGLTDKLPAGWVKGGGTETKAAAAGVDEHSYFPAEDSLSCECGLPADAGLHTDPAETKATYASIESTFTDLEAKADTKPGDGNLEKLRAWYLNPARSKIQWGKPGDFDQCVRIARKHMTKPGMAEGFCSNLHLAATGERPGRNAHGGGKKTAEPPPINSGGVITGAGAGDDSIPAQLTTGEYVLPADATLTHLAAEATTADDAQLPEPLTGDGTGEALAPVEREGKLLEWAPDAEVGPLAAHQSTETKRVTGPGFDDSLENRRERIRAAVTDRLAGEDDTDGEVTLLGTWPDRAIAARLTYDTDGVTAHQAYTVPYDIDDAGQVTVGDPTPVELTIDPYADAEPSADTQELAQRVATNLAATVNTALDEATLAGKTLAATLTGHEVKAGRVLSRVNVTRLQQAVTALIAVLRAAGVDVVPPSEQQVRDVQDDGGGEPPVAPDSTSPGLRETKTAGGEVLTAAELAEGLALLADAAALELKALNPDQSVQLDMRPGWGVKPAGGGLRGTKTAEDGVLTAAEFAEGLAVLADVLALDVKAAGGDLGSDLETKGVGRWDESKHPRDARGWFIEVGGKVKIGPIAGAGQGTVVGRTDNGRIIVRRDGQPAGAGTAFDPKHLTMIAKADGTAVEGKPGLRSAFKRPPTLPTLADPNARTGFDPGPLRGVGNAPRTPVAGAGAAPDAGGGSKPRPDFAVSEVPGKGWVVKTSSTGHTLSAGHASREEAVARSDEMLTDAEYDAHTKRVEELVKENWGRGTQFEFADSHDKATDRFNWKPDRAELHRQIANELVEAAKAKGVPSERKAVMSGGLGGAGKGTVLRSPESGIDKSQYLTIDPDEFKAELIKRGMAPKVEGLSPMEGAALIHEESSEIAMVTAELAYEQGLNLIWDITMSNDDSVRKRLQALERHGYATEAVFVDIPVELSVQRALGRHRGGLEDYRAGASDVGGRYVPPSYIRKSEMPGGPPPNSKNRATFDMFKPWFARYSVWDTGGTGGAERVDQGGAPEPQPRTLRNRLRDIRDVANPQRA